MRKRENLPGGALADVNPDDDLDDRQYINALARGLEVLRAFDPADGPLGNGELAAKTGLAKPTISRITYTLSKQGFLEFNPKNSKYSLGPSVLALGFNYLNGQKIRQIARPHLIELAMAVDGVVALGVRDRMSIVYLQTARGPSDRTIRLDVGARLPIHHSAAGWAYLHALSQAERRNLVSVIERDAGNEWPAISALLKIADQEMQKYGFCKSLGTYERGFNSIATSWRAPQGRGCFAINVTGVESAFPVNRLVDEIGPRLRAAVDNIENDWSRMIDQS